MTMCILTMIAAPSSRLLVQAAAAAARTAVRGSSAAGSLAPSSTRLLSAASAAAGAPKKKKNVKGGNTDTLSDDTSSYAAQKAQAKERRRITYQNQQDRIERLRTRRSNVPKSPKRDEFRSWFDQYRTRNETMDRKARQAGLPWKVRVCAVVERLPVVLPDKEEWETNYEELSAYLKQFGRDYPKELGFTKEGPNLEAGERFDLSYEEILEMLPDGFKPAPRETEADANGDIKTRDRKLKERAYLTVQGKDSNGSWAQFPSTYVNEQESLLDAAKRATNHAVGSKLQLYCPSNAPMAVDMYAYKEKKDHFGIKTFFLRVQWDDGDVDAGAMKVDDFGWLARDEVVDRIKEQRGEVPSKLYHYLL